MKLRQWITLAILALLVAAAALGLVWTQPPAQAADPTVASSAVPAPKSAWRKAPPKQRQQVVDQRLLQTARGLILSATTPEEERLVRQALRLADHEVDLAFADALRSAADAPKSQDPEVKRLQALKTKAQAAMAADQEAIALLSKEAASGSGERQSRAQDQLDVAKAQMELDQDELDSASEDLERAGGDPQAKIKRLIASREASGKEVEPATPVFETPETFPGASLLARSRNWMALKSKLAKLELAQEAASAKAERLAKWHDKLVERLQHEKAGAGASTQKAPAPSGDVPAPAPLSALDALKQHVRDQKNLADVSKRLEDLHDLRDTYGDWIVVVQTRQLTVLHALADSALWILAVLLAVYAGCRVIEQLFGGFERRKAGTIRSLMKLCLRIAGLVLIIFVILGMPTQTTTVLGLAGAGLTVAMKDFIVAFFGWFVLMGRNGIHVGDWVEIKGVGGEVVEIGMLRTVLLETGGWSDSGHPTGRRVAFVNSFAIEGHYFNFTTTGQWMWDQLTVLVPLGQDPYPVIDGIQKLVAQKTEANAKEAEQEWQRATTRYKVQAFSAAPGINVVPTNQGIEVHVRYITRAFERHEIRHDLYQSVVELMHGKRPDAAPAG